MSALPNQTATGLPAEGPPLATAAPLRPADAVVLTAMAERVLRVNAARRPHASLRVAPEPHPGYFAAKRAMDLVFGFVLLMLALPLLLVAALAVLVMERTNPLYVQRRVGMLGREFRLLKIRTMHNGADRDVPLTLNETNGPTFKARDDPRVTRLGRVLRQTSIDEMPQFVNVILGQVSLVGPRPALPQEVAQYTRTEAQRLTVKPGLTGVWQVSGRSDIPFRDWMAMDRLYVRRRSLLFDLWLLARTPWVVLRMKGAR